MEIRLPYPHPGQIRVRNEARRFNWLSAGRRWRKTTMAMSIAVEEALAGKVVFWGAPTYDQVRVGWDETYHGTAGSFRFSQQRMTAYAPTGGRIIFRSLDDPDNARGHTADGIIIDEIGDVKPTAWYEVLSPILIDTGGWFWGIGTPRGRNWFYVEHQRAKERPDSISWQVPALGVVIQDDRLIRKPHPYENPFLPFADVERQWQTTTRRHFEQEILADFVDDAGSVFRRVLEAATAQKIERRTNAAQSFVFGVDWGKYNDYTVIVVLDAGTKSLVYLDRFNQIDYAIQMDRLRALADRFRPHAITAEQNAIGVPIIEQLQRLGLPIQPFMTTNASKTQAIDALALAFERGDIKILDDPTLIGELQAYSMERLPSGMLRYSAPEGMHDDCVMALAIAWSQVADRLSAPIEFNSTRIRREFTRMTNYMRA